MVKIQDKSNTTIIHIKTNTNTKIMKLKSTFTICFAVLFFFSFKSSFAQNNNEKDEVSVEKKLFKADLLMPGLNYELKLNKNTTFNVNPHFLRTNYDHLYDRLNRLSSSSPSLGSTIIVYEPTKYTLRNFLDLQVRYYYNLKKRTEKGKNIRMNSGNYFSAKLLFEFFQFTDVKDKSLPNRSTFYSPKQNSFVGLMWGMQRTLPIKLNYTIEAGVMAGEFSPFFIGPYASLTFGYVISKKSNRKI
ncbi:MAG: hypothetical protein CFE22_10325 [Cytophagaceae bacterium BCCC1]|nr:MAG: hypothetical protein CFE22_10325 [Cytophagaceae bacterium BCCC1]